MGQYIKIIWGLLEVNLVSLMWAKQASFGWGIFGWRCCKQPQQDCLKVEPPCKNCLTF